MADPSGMRARSSAPNKDSTSDPSSSKDSTCPTSTTTGHDYPSRQGASPIYTLTPKESKSGSSSASMGASNVGNRTNTSGQSSEQESEPLIQTRNLGPLCTWTELPTWLQDNPAILTGYRRPTFSYKKCFDSLGFLHNESVNIWSHLLGALVCIVVSPLVYFKYIGLTDTIRWTDVAVFYIFMAGAVACLSMSALFHTFSCHSEPIAHQWNRCDYVGIVFLIVGSFYPAIFYGFYCYKTWQIVYTTLISIFGAATIVAVVRPEFRTPQYRWIRSSLFLAMGLSGIIPALHGLALYGYHLADKAISLRYMICMGGCYVFGALLYASRIPERFFPGKLDHFGASHQIFHVCVLLGCLSHFLGVTKAMAFWHDSNHSCSIPIEQMRAVFNK